MIRIVIADDHAIVRKGLRQILADEDGNVTIEEASTGQELLVKVRGNPFDLVLLDISMPGRDGLEILKDLRVEFPKLPVLILSVHPEEEYAIRAIRAGASGYLTKSSAPEELITAIRRVLAGKKYISSSLSERLADVLSVESDRPLHAALSDREYQVFCMIARGKSTREIGLELALSEKTIGTYRARILDKTGLKNNAEIIRYSIKNRLID